MNSSGKQPSRENNSSAGSYRVPCTFLGSWGMEAKAISQNTIYPALRERAKKSKRKPAEAHVYFLEQIGLRITNAEVRDTRGAPKIDFIFPGERIRYVITGNVDKSKKHVHPVLLVFTMKRQAHEKLNRKCILIQFETQIQTEQALKTMKSLGKISQAAKSLEDLLFSSNSSDTSSTGSSALLEKTKQFVDAEKAKAEKGKVASKACFGTLQKVQESLRKEQETDDDLSDTCTSIHRPSIATISTDGTNIEDFYENSHEESKPDTFYSNKECSSLSDEEYKHLHTLLMRSKSRRSSAVTNKLIDDGMY
eukprot:m.40616 g.40616  ORF g.40616 m.40616 type:complete len:308 (+) comp9686_c0_seq1:99-1022(+)